jgi:hypothetical protein
MLNFDLTLLSSYDHTKFTGPASGAFLSKGEGDVRRTKGL